MRTLAALLLATGATFSAWVSKPRADNAAQNAPGQQVVRKNVAVKMRDGVTLRANVMLPAAEGKFPVLVYRTPYGKDRAPSSWTTFPKAVARGYAVVIQDVRGRYESEGDFTPYQTEGRDGYDTIEWAAAQPWSNGSVGTFGLSYPGAVQWLAAIENPPHLKAMVPAMTFSTPRNFFYSGGVFDGSWLDWIWFNIAPDIRKRKNLPGPKTRDEVRDFWKHNHERMQKFLPIAELPDLKDVAPFYYEWLAHPPADSWWDWAELRGKYDRVHAAVLNISGWYDEAYGPDGATTNFNGLLAARKNETNPRTATIIGPWTHGELGRTFAGHRDFGKAAAVDYDEIILRWMDHYLKGEQNGVEKDKPVHIFVMGDNSWHDEDSWPLARAEEKTLFLSSWKNSETGTRSLKTTVCLPCESFSPFASDPADPVTDPYTDLGARDYRELVGRKDVLAFDTEPLLEDLEVTGPVQARIYVSADVPDFDLWVRILDVSPDGTAYNLMSPGLDVLRASYRGGSTQPDLVKPGEIVRLNLERLLTSNVFKAGHRIRVQISGAFFPHFSRNLQTGKSEVTSSETRVAHIRIYNDHGHSSRVILPVIPRTAGAAVLQAQPSAVIHRLDGSTITTTDAETFAKATLDKENVTGTQIAVVENGRLVWNAAFGLRGRNPDLPMDPETTTWAASITKGVFATYVMQLVERGEFQLDVPVATQLPQPLDRYEAYKETGTAIVFEPDWPLVTPRMLLSHTSGLLNFAYLEPDKKLHLHFKPGTKFSYSGEGINLVQFLIEQQKQKPLDHLMQEALFTPLEIKRTGLIYRQEFEANVADRFDLNGKFRATTRRFPARGAGSLSSSTADLARFAIALLDDKILKPSTRAEMLKPYIQIRTLHQFALKANEGDGSEAAEAGLAYGMGWGLLMKTRFGSAFFKEGHGDGAQNYMICFERSKSCMIVLTNSDNGELAFRPLLEKILGDTVTPWEWEGYTREYIEESRKN